MKTLGQSDEGDHGQTGAAYPEAGMAPERLLQNHARLRLAIQASGVGLWEWDLATNQVYFSPEYKRQLGRADAALQEDFGEWESRLHPEDHARVMHGLRAYLAEPGPGYEAEYRLRRKDGTYRWMLARAEPVCDAAGRPCRMLGCQLDITERKAAEADHARLAAIVESSEDAIIGKTLEGIVTDWNEGARRLFGYTAEEMVGQPILRLIPPDRFDEEAQILARLRRGERVEHYETVRRRKDDRFVDVSLSVSPIRDGGGQLIGASKIARDITERKAAEAELGRSQGQLRALAARLQQAREEEAVRLARELHDQLGRCLTTLKLDVGAIERGLRGGLTDDRARAGLLEAAQRMGQALDETVRTVRRISAELRPGVLDDLGLAAAIDWQAKDFQKRSGVACVLRLPEDDPPLSREQATALFRIFQEGLTNVARHARARTVWVHLGEEGSHVVLEIEDDGVGFSPAALAERRSLGLLGMRERAAAFGGEVEVAGSPGRGVTVLVRLPLGGAREGCRIVDDPRGP